MNVNFDGQTYSFEVKPGPAGYKQFTQAIREAFSLPEDSELNITFTCDEPSQGMHVSALVLLHTDLLLVPALGSKLQHSNRELWSSCVTTTQAVAWPGVRLYSDFSL